MGLLVLTRKQGERIRLGKDIWLTLVEIDRNKVRLGIEAPREIDIRREELLSEQERYSVVHGGEG